MKLWQIAHVRTGDKGNISNVSVTVYDTKDFNLLQKLLKHIRDFKLATMGLESIVDEAVGSILCR